MSPTFPGLDPDDMDRLSALASGRPPMPFDEAYVLLENGSPRDEAQAAYENFIAYWTPPDDYVPKDPEAEADLA